MSPNPNWSRWISASISQHFRTSSQGLDFPFYIEGQQRGNEVENFALLKLSGPKYNELQQNYWEIIVLPYIFIHIVQDGRDVYRLDRLLGNFTSYFQRTIPVFEYGDSGNQFGCLSISREIQVNKFGQSVVATPVAQATIEATYYMTQRRV